MSKTEDYIQHIEGAERRFYVAPVTMEKRADDDNDQQIIEGYAALYNSQTDLRWFKEEILPGAFDDCLKDDVRCLFNHNPNYILARSKEGKGTLTLSLDKQGLKYRYATPDRTYAKDLADAIANGDVSQSSFGFIADEVRWIEKEGEESLRQIVKVKQLFDVSPVTYPAYQDTSVAKRSFQDFKKESGAPTPEDHNGTARAENLDVFEAQYLFNKNNS